MNNNLPRITEKERENLADLFKAMGEKSRIKILEVLIDGDSCVKEISELTGLSQSLVSHHMNILKNARVVLQKRRGKNVYYELEDEHVRNLYLQGRDHILHLE
ncbi:MAG: metalloregulator ArsR/SmtB family transcription factor [Ezakiella sp.]|nr:metalloregulator ArsR/SmtB family transcription factor [Ezakiella sp.]MDD7762227.1 metalloregulator ArsR/SmtB family transcription factor [Bacillota bacterium]MDY3947275.1 metalloregulator ArsR/SmtB family transcription factor [Ezakiella sp.]